jgi:hypothetical protein
MSDFEAIRDQLREEILGRAVDETIKALLTAPPGWQGFSGVRSLFDEVKPFVPSWTPKQFNIMWDQFSHQTKVNYIRNLIEPKDF